MSAIAANSLHGRAASCGLAPKERTPLLMNTAVQYASADSASRLVLSRKPLVAQTVASIAASEFLQ
jgi:hypothetical protein